MKQKQKNMYDPKIKTVKYLVLFDQKDQNKSILNFRNASKVGKCTRLGSIHSIFNASLLKLYITTAHTLNCCYLKFEKIALKFNG